MTELLSSYARFAGKYDAMFELLTPVIKRRFFELSIRPLDRMQLHFFSASILVAYAQNNMYDKELFDMILNSMSENMDVLEYRNMADAVYAMSLVNHQHLPYLRAIDTEFRKSHKSMELMPFSIVAKAMVALDYHQPVCFIADVVIQRSTEWTYFDIAHWSALSLKPPCANYRQQFLDTIFKEAERLLPTCPPVYVCSTFHSTAMLAAELNQTDHPVFDIFCAEILNRILPKVQAGDIAKVADGLRHLNRPLDKI